MNKETETILGKLKKNKSCVYVNDIYRLIMKQNKSNSSHYNIFNKLSSLIVFISRIIVSGILIVLNIFKKKKISCENEIGFARVPRTSIKLKRIKENIQIVSDDINNHDFSIYQIGERRKRLIFLFFGYVKQCIEDYKSIYRITLDKDIYPYRKFILEEMVKRIPHTIVYRYSAEYIIKGYKLETIYTGQMYDRHALIEENASKKYKKKLICIPHGVESTLEMPVGYVGHEFYCTSNHMCIELRKLYNSNKFLYSSVVTKKIFKVKTKSRDCAKKFIFFTQPTNQNRDRKSVV